MKVNMKHAEDILLFLLRLRILIMLLQGTEGRDFTNDSLNHQGKSFLLGFLQMEKDFGACTIYVTSSAPSEINITVPFLNQTITKQTIPGVSTKIDLSTTIRMRGFGLENKGVFVNANTTVSVYATNAKGNSRDAFVIFPIAILRTEYVVATYAPRTKSLVGIIALQDDTLVQIKLHLRENITYKGNVYKNGDILRIFLNKLQTFQLQSSEDLTGTFVVSTRPVAVLGGNICANVPTGVTGCSHICTQLVPVSKWGTRFMTSPIVKRKRNDYFRIISAFDNTTIKIYGKKSRTLNASGHYEFSLGNEEARYIKCSKPAMLMQYNKGSANYIQSEPFALTVPPVEQYTSVYNLPIPVENKKPPFLNCISFIAKTGERIVFDNKKFCRKVNLTSIPIEQSNYTVYSCSLRKVNLSTVIPIRHALEGGTLAVYMVGHTDKDGYGYLGGMGMRDVNCIRLFQNGLTTSNSCDDGIEKDMVNITGCDWKSSKNKIPRIKSEYLHGSEVSHRVSQTGDCKDVITRTYKLKIPNGSYAILAQQEIQWNKQKPTIQLPQQTLVTEFNSTSLEKIVRKMSLLCPGDILYFNDSSSDWVNGTKVIQRLWTVQETCGRVTTAKQTIIVQDSNKTNPDDQSSHKIVFIISLSLGASIVLLAIVAILCLALTKFAVCRKPSKSRKITVEEANEKVDNGAITYINPHVTDKDEVLIPQENVDANHNNPGKKYEAIHLRHTKIAPMPNETQ